MSRLACVAVDLAHFSRFADAETRTRVTRLVEDMQARARGTRFTRLESEPSLARTARGVGSKLVRRALPRAATVLPPGAVSLAEELSLAAAYRPSRSRLPTRLGANVVWCPAVGPAVHDPRVPLACGIDSLACLAYPESFGFEEAFARRYLMNQATRLAARVVCPSEFVRGEVLAMRRVAPERVVVIRPGVPRSESAPPAVANNGFLLCPAPFVGLANHRLLLMAFGLYRRQHPDSSLKLVCVGSPGPELAVLEHSVKQMQLQAHVSLCVDWGRLAALVQSCRGVILPTLYEASGLAALTAMAAGVPVLSSGAGALAEVVGDADVRFDPRLASSLIEAIAVADAAPEGYRGLGLRGRARLAQLGGEAEAEQYLRLLSEVA